MGMISTLATVFDIGKIFYKTDGTSEDVAKALAAEYEKLHLVATDGSITKLLKPTIIEPVIIVSSKLKDYEYTDHILRLNTHMFGAYFMQAFQILTSFYDMKATYAIDLLSTDTGGVGRIIDKAIKGGLVIAGDPNMGGDSSAMIAGESRMQDLMGNSPFLNIDGSLKPDIGLGHEANAYQQRVQDYKNGMKRGEQIGYNKGTAYGYNKGYIEAKKDYESDDKHRQTNSQIAKNESDILKNESDIQKNNVTMTKDAHDMQNKNDNFNLSKQKFAWDKKTGRIAEYTSHGMDKQKDGTYSVQHFNTEDMWYKLLTIRLELRFTDTKTVGRKDGEKGSTTLSNELVIPITIKSHVIYTHPSQIVNMIRPTEKKNNFFSRLDDWRSTAISFKELMFCSDLIKKYKDAKFKDRDGLLTMLQDRRLSANTKVFPHGIVGFEKSYNMFVLDDSDMPEIEAAVRGNPVKSEKHKQDFLQNAGGFSFTVVNQDYERGAIFTSDIRGKTDLPLKIIAKNSGKKDVDYEELMKALMTNRPPQF